VKSEEEAIEWVKRCPNPHNEDAEIEIRQIFEMEDFGAEMSRSSENKKNACGPTSPKK
jgi:hypothetical protein